MSKKDFNEFRFAGLNARSCSNRYMTMNRVNEDETKIVVKVASEQLQPTKYGYALILDESHVVFLKPWQVSENYYGNEVLLDKKYFNVKEWGDFPDFEDNADNLNFDTWLLAAKDQDTVIEPEDGERRNRVKWEI